MRCQLRQMLAHFIRFLGKLRTAGKYNSAKDELEYILKKIPAVGGKLASAAERVKDSLKYLLVSGVFFEELGFHLSRPSGWS